MTVADPPLVSVIIPTYNRAQLLRRSIFSVLAQTYRNLELIVVDDCSTDDTPAIVSAIADSRLRYLRRQQNGHAAAARNQGIAAARGELIAFQDDDDCWLVQKLEKQVHALLAAPAEVGWCLGSYIALEPWGCRYIGGEFYFSQIDYRRGSGFDGPKYNLIATPNWLVKREVLERAGPFDDRLRSWDDWELGLRLDRITRKIHVDEPLWVQSHGGGMMRAERARASDMRIIMQKHGAMWAANKRVLARHWYVIGRAEAMFDAVPAGRAELMISLRLDPWRPKTWIALALSCTGRTLVQRLTRAIRQVREWGKQKRLGI